MTDPLRCAEARELAPEVALGIAAAEDRARLFWHAAGCAACRDVLSELSALTDDVLALTPEHEPHAGFETQVLARIGDRTPRRRRWRRVALLAAALVVTAAVSGGAVYRELAAGVRATLATANGQYFAAAPLDETSGERRGVAFGYQGDPAWIFVTVSVPAPSGRYTVEVVTHAGAVHRLADDVDLAATGSWGSTIPVAIHEIAVVRVLDADGRLKFCGRFLLP
jgi:hypothetical protein